MRLGASPKLDRLYFGLLLLPSKTPALSPDLKQLGSLSLAAQI